MPLNRLLPAALLAILCTHVSCKKEIATDNINNNGSINAEMQSSNTTADDVLETALPVHTPILYNINSNVAGYYETLPARYALTTKKYPLIIFIHGIGELGTGLSRLNCCGLPYHAKTGTFPPKFLVNGVYYSYIVISPQFKVRPSAAQVQSVIDFAKSKYRIDEMRIYVAGLSMGGGSTWDWSVYYGEKAAAIVPVCAGTAPTTTLAASVATKNLPIWSLNSSDDAVVPVQWAKDWISWIDARNTAMAPYTKLTIWTGLTHNGTWGKAFNPVTKVDGYNIYEWMLLYRRGTTTAATTTTTSTTTSSTTTTTNKPPIANAGTDRTIPISWNYFPTLNATLSTDSDGWIAGFKWSKVSGPSSYSFSSPYSAQTKVNNLVAGTYVFRVTVTDNKGATDTDDVTITMTNN
jgi:pimeloyl-ACP methyl ester carboxylesterase